VHEAVGYHISHCACHAQSYSHTSISPNPTTNRILLVCAPLLQIAMESSRRDGWKTVKLRTEVCRVALVRVGANSKAFET